MVDLYILISFAVISLVISCWAQIKVNSAYNTYSKILAGSRITAKVLARQILDIAGLNNIDIVHVHGTMTDYYDHKNKKLALSDGVGDSSSVAGLGIAMHEVGHALQYKYNYFPIKIRKFVGVLTSFMSKSMWLLFIAGIVLDLFIVSGMEYGNTVLTIALVLLILTTLFNLVTIPVELDASRRAYDLLKSTNALNDKELAGAKKVLNAAALTYVASFVISILNLLRFLILFNRRR